MYRSPIPNEYKEVFAAWELERKDLQKQLEHLHQQDRELTAKPDSNKVQVIAALWDMFCELFPPIFALTGALVIFLCVLYLLLWPCVSWLFV